jgi:8-oxo-dGTP pyrophosphatase MutT (NUDIX family)
MPLNYLDMLDEVRAIAQTGINYARSPYDLQQYKRLLELASMKYADITGLDKDVIIQRFSADLGYITPKIGVQCALFNSEGKLLLERRSDDALYGLPAGWVDNGETPEMAIVRELKEETGLTIEVEKMLGFYTRLPGQHAQPHTSVHILYGCKLVGGELTISHESLELGYYDPLTITEWHKDHGIQAMDALRDRESRLPQF